MSILEQLLSVFEQKKMGLLVRFPPYVFKDITGNDMNDFDSNLIHSHQSKEQTANKKFNVGNRGTTD